MSIKLPFFKKKKNNKQVRLNLDKIPAHVAIIMDGNGRWAKKRGLPRIAGHHEGMKVVKKIVKRASDLNVEVLTLYAFSTENWKRPKEEVDYLMKLPMEFLSTYLPELIENNVKVQTIGDFNLLPEHTKQAVGNAIEKTAQNNGMILNFALNYGSRDEMLRAIKKIACDLAEEKLTMEDIDESLYSSYLYTNDLPDPDLLIRTSGEIRLSNFLLWQLAYTEFWFTDIYWPDFDENEFEKALSDYQTRKRRYGGL